MCHRPCSSIGFRALVYGTRGCGFEPRRGHSEQEATPLLIFGFLLLMRRWLNGRVTVSKTVGCWVETSPTREDGIAWLLSHSRIQSSQAIPSQWFWAAFRNFPYFLSEPSSINAPLAELVDALGSNPSSLRSEGSIPSWGTSRE